MKRKIALVFLLWFMVGTAFAQQSPVTLLEKVSKQAMGALKAKRATIKRNPQAVYSIVRRIILPHFDVAGMSRAVLGRNAWQTATGAQKRQFQQQFTTLVIRTYSAGLAAYTNEKITFYPVRGGYQGRNRVQVYSVIVRPNGSKIPVSYRLKRWGSTWKVYDFSVDSVSLIRSFRSQFTPMLSQGGLKKLLVELTKHNARNR